MRAVELSRACGYLLILVPPLLLGLSAWSDWPALAFVSLILVAPFLRSLFGDAPEHQPEWSEPVATFLEALPGVAAVAFLAAIAALVVALARKAWTSGELARLGLSLWSACIFASCFAHELIHRRSLGSRVLGRVVSGVLGYPLLEHEHRAHHAKGGDVEAGEWPAVNESLWAFTARRTRRVLFTAWEGDIVAAARRGHRLAGGLPLSTACTALTALVFALAGGLAAFATYVAVVAAVAWTMQAITYVQHWGLGSDSVPDADAGDHGWEDRCQLQAWLTLSISYHQAHHHRNSVPYYRQEPMRGSPRQPAGYVILLFASMVPPVWRRLMMPALERWKRTPHAPCSAGRRLVCMSR
jgi:alkane 1-monooxygenase